MYSLAKHNAGRTSPDAS